MVGEGPATLFRETHFPQLGAGSQKLGASCPGHIQLSAISQTTFDLAKCCVSKACMYHVILGCSEGHATDECRFVACHQ